MQLENVRLFDGTGDRLQDGRRILIQEDIISEFSLENTLCVDHPLREVCAIIGKQEK